MYDRYLIQLPKKASPNQDEVLLAEVLGKLENCEINLHRELFLHPINYTNVKGTLIWKNSSMRTSHRKDPMIILKRNVYNIAKNLENLGLLMTQLTWSGILKMSEKYIIMRQSSDLCRAVELMCILMNKDSSLFCRFIAALRMTDNSELAHILEVHERELTKKQQLMHMSSSTHRKCTSRRSAAVATIEDTMTDEYCIINEPNSPMKKRKTSADSGFEEDVGPTDDATVTDSKSKEKTSLKYNEAVPLSSKDNHIAIQNGCEDKMSSVVLCKCGDYHQLPKWKHMSAQPKKEEKTEVKTSQRTILHPVTTVEVGCDYVDLSSLEQSSKFTKPRGSCEFHKLRFHRSCKPGDCQDDDDQTENQVHFATVSVDLTDDETIAKLKLKKKHPFTRLLRAFM